MIYGNRHKGDRHSSDNSFFYEAYDGIKIILFSPHEDDEINIAGMLLYSLARQGAEIYVVYATNGDWKYPAKIREKEAVRSLKLLGIREDHAIFLGYGDSFKASKDHLFYNQSTVTASPSGHHETYGPGKHSDYSFQRNGKHHEYTRDNFVKDLISVLDDIHPDLIICNDLDEHPDHRLLSVCLDEAVNSVIHESDDYRPLVWKSMAYACAYNSIPDYSCMNNMETKEPVQGVTEKYQTGFINSFYYNWDERVRIPVPQAAQSGSIIFNLGTKMLRMHHSQHIFRRADRIINSDQIFWERRTDSLSTCARIAATSGSCESLKGFSPYKVSNIDHDRLAFSRYGWMPDSSDPDKTATYSWEPSVSIRMIRLFPVVLDDETPFHVRIQMSDGYSTVVPELRCDGKAICIDTGIHEKIDWVTVSLVHHDNKSAGLALCEMFDSLYPHTVIKPFCKILIKDTFAYQYLVDKSVEKLPISVFQYRPHDDIQVDVTKGLSRVENNELFIDSNDAIITLTAHDTGFTICDKITIVRIGKIRKLVCRYMDSIGKCYMRYGDLQYRIARKWYSLKKKMSVLKH